MKPTPAIGVSDVADHLQIMQLLNRYALAVDRRDFASFRLYFAPDVYARFGSTLTWKDLEAWIADFEVIHTRFAATQHIITNHVIDVAGDTAHAWSYGHIFLWERGAPTKGRTIGNVYRDVLARRMDSWRITRRECDIIWQTDEVVTSPAGAVVGLWEMAEPGAAPVSEQSSTPSKE